MPKINDHDRQLYQEKIGVYSTMIKALLKNESDLLTHLKKNPPDMGIKKISLVNEMLNLASGYMAINGISMAVLKVKNEEALNDARKSMYKAVIYLEEIVSNYIDASFSDYEDKLAAIESFDQNQRYNLIRKIGLAIDMLQNAYGDNSKWRWTFVELEGRFAATSKNILDLRNAVANSRPESEYYESTVYHLRLVKELLSRAASRYRDKYELSTQQMLDFKTGILFLSALKRIHIVLSESEEAEAIKKKLSIWSTKLEMDLKRQEEAKKKK
jgi:hypothetical protein